MTKKMIDSDLLLEYVLGSGMFSYAPWWFDMEETEDGVTMTSEEGVHTVTATKVRSAFVKLVMEGFPAFQGVDLTDPDIDAELGDCIMQQACYGDVIYG